MVSCGNAPTRWPACAPAGLEEDRQVGGEPVLDGIPAQHVRPSEVSLELLEDGAEFGEDNIIGGDEAVRLVFPVREQGVRT
jgi:hypothetical protein